MRRWKAHRGKVAALSFSRDGRYLASVTGSGKDVFIWDATAGELVRKLTPEKDDEPEFPRINAASVAFAPEADLLAVGRKHWVEVWDTEGWDLVSEANESFGDVGHSRTAYELEFGPGDYPLLLSGHTQIVHIWGHTVDQRKLQHRGTRPLLKNAQLATSPDGNAFVTHTVQSVEVWNIHDKDDLLHMFHHPRGNYTGPVRYSPDGSRIAFASTKTIESHPASLDDPNDMIRYVGHKNKVWVLRYTPDGRSLISASSDGTARVWDADSGAEKRCFEFDVGKMLAADVSPDGTIAAVGGATGEIIVWDLD